jgi:hypothetical protein
MTLTADNVEVGVTGGVYVADVGTSLPNDTTDVLNAAFDDVGYISDDGVVESQGSDTTDIKAWQNGDIVRKVQTKHELTYKFTMIETSETTQGVFYGNYSAGAVEITGEQLDHKSWIIHVIDGDDKIRIVIPDGQITERGDVSYKNDDAISYPVTITCFPDGDGVKATKYLSGTGS